MARKNRITDFVEKQEVLNNIETSIRKLYAGDELMENENFLKELTRRTLTVINHYDIIFDELLAEPGIIKTAESFDVPVEKIADDIVEIMMFSTIARQNIIIETLQGGEE